MNTLVKQIQSDLQAKATPEFAASQRRFFKETIKVRGVRSPDVDLVRRKYFPQIKTLPKEEVFALCEELLKSGYIEDAFAAYGFAEKLSKHFEKSDFKVLEHWLKTYV